MSPTRRLPRRQPRRGMIAVQVALSLTALTGILAIAVDGGLMLAVRRQAQATADAAALAAAADLYKGNGSTDATTSAQDVGVSNGFTRSNVVINIPPLSGPFKNGTPNVTPTDKNSYAEAIVTYNQGRYFSNVFGGGTIPITARAVARGTQPRSSPGILVLTPTGTGLSVVGNGTLTESGGPVVVNSSSTSAAHDTGNGTMRAQEFDVTGSIAGISGLTTAPTANNIHAVNGPLAATAPTPDPLSYLPAPTQPPNGTITSVNGTGGAKTYTLTPGTFTNLPNFTSKDTVIFKQASAGNGGIYYLASGGLTANSAILQMDPNTSGGMMIYNAGTGQNDGISIAGNSGSSTILSGLTSGTYAGMLFFQARNASEDLSITGNGNFTMTGTIYAAGATLKAAGNGANNTVASQVIANAMTIAGNGTVTVTDVNSSNPKTRQLQLVE
jgi:Flp pilus assembly protein TadG